MESKIKSKSEIFKKYLKNYHMVETIAVIHTIELDFNVAKRRILRSINIGILTLKS